MVADSATILSRANQAGACWPFITAKFGQFMFGSYPEEERWRVLLTYVLAVAGLAPLMIPQVPGKLWSALYTIVLFPVLAVILLSGGVLGLSHIPTDFWGGLLVGFVQQVSALVLSPQLQNAAIFVVFLLIVGLRPEGLFGRSAERA